MASSWGRTGPGPRFAEGAVGRDLRVGSKPEHTGSLELRLRLTPYPVISECLLKTLST